MPHRNIEQILSISRFKTYRDAIIERIGKDDPAKALRLYEVNAQLATRFFLPIHIYEVALRNAIAEAISMRYGTNWHRNDNFLNSLKMQKRNELTKINGLNVNKMLAELRFAWFEHILTRAHHVRIWRDNIQVVFPNAPIDMSPDQLRNKLHKTCHIVRNFRNRCGHHEPIFNNNYLPEILPLLLESLEWRSPQTSKWLQSLQTVDQMLEKYKQITNVDNN